MFGDECLSSPCLMCIAFWKTGSWSCFLASLLAGEPLGAYFLGSWAVLPAWKSRIVTVPLAHFNIKLWPHITSGSVPRYTVNNSIGLKSRDGCTYKEEKESTLNVEGWWGMVRIWGTHMFYILFLLDNIYIYYFDTHVRYTESTISTIIRVESDYGLFGVRDTIID